MSNRKNWQGHFKEGKLRK